MIAILGIGFLAGAAGFFAAMGMSKGSMKYGIVGLVCIVAYLALAIANIR